MKTFITSIIFLGLANLGFGQVNFNSAQEVGQYIQGEWNWLETKGGFSGNQCINPDTVGYTQHYKFELIPGIDDRAVYHMYQNDTLITNDTLLIVFENGTFGEVWSLQNVQGLTVSTASFAQATTLQMYLRDHCFDCYTHLYERFVSGTNAVQPNIEARQLVYPNPSSGQFFFKNFHELIGSKIEISNSTGQVVVSQIINEQHLDLSNLGTGLFTLMINGKNEQRWMQKIVIVY